MTAQLIIFSCLQTMTATITETMMIVVGATSGPCQLSVLPQTRFKQTPKEPPRPPAVRATKRPEESLDHLGGYALGRPAPHLKESLKNLSWLSGFRCRFS